MSTKNFYNLLQYKFFTIAFLLFSISFLSGCNEESDSSTYKSEIFPLTPGELGYYQKFNDLILDTKKHSYDFLKYSSLIALDNEVNQTVSERQKRDRKDAFNSLKKISDENLSHLQKVLPPKSMEEFHSEWLELLEGFQNLNSSEELTQQNKDFQNVSFEFDNKFTSRAKKYPNSKESTVEFQPYFAPVSVDLSTFEVSFSKEISTPIGEFEIASAPEEKSDVSKLVIEHRNQFRYLSLAPGFEVYIPAQCGMNIKNSEPNTLSIRVPQCQADIAQRDNSKPIEPVQTEKPISLPISSYSNYPKSSCGDSHPTDISGYPVTFYPVHIGFSEENLRNVKANFCKDAYALGDKSKIQVASFTREDKAEEFRKLMQENFSNAELASPVVFN